MSVLGKSAGHRVELVRDGLWRVVFHLPTSTNCWIYQEDDGLTLVDAGNSWNASTILDTIQTIGQPLKRIIVTHAHPDHAGAAAAVAKETGAIVFAHESEAPFLMGRASVADSPGSLMSRGLHNAARWLNILNPPAVDIVEPLTDGDYVGSLRVIHAPGHTPGSISLWSDKEKALFLGDNASNRMQLLQINWSWFTLDIETLQKSFRRYTEYPATMLLVGHGAVFQSENAVSDLIKSIRKPNMLAHIR